MESTIEVNDLVRINDYTKVPEEYQHKVIGVVFRVTDEHPILPVFELTNETTGEQCTVGKALVSLVMKAEEEEDFDASPCTEIPLDSEDGPMTAGEFLRAAAETLIKRGKSRDNGQERSMARTVRTFNAMTGHELTEEEGWLFMRYLKDARARSGEYNRDDFLDGVGYAALQAECADRTFANSHDDEEFDA